MFSNTDEQMEAVDDFINSLILSKERFVIVCNLTFACVKYAKSHVYASD